MRAAIPAGSCSSSQAMRSGSGRASWQRSSISRAVRGAAGVAVPLPARQSDRTVPLALLNEAHHPVQLLLGDQRGDGGVLGARTDANGI